MLALRLVHIIIIFKLSVQFLYDLFLLYLAATVNIESVLLPPNEGDDAGVAAQLSLTINPTTAMLDTTITVDVTVLTIGIETAVGKIT